MSTVVILGSGVMGSALAVPLADNGHDVRLVGTHLDREIIATIKATGVHPGLGRELPAAVRAYELEELERACTDAEIVLSGVNSLGVRWAGERLAPLLREGQLVAAIAEGVTADAAGRLGHPTLEGAAAIKVFGAALVKLAERGVVADGDFPLMRHLYEVIALERPLDVPWSRFFGGEPTKLDAVA